MKALARRPTAWREIRVTHVSRLTHDASTASAAPRS